MLSLGDQGGPQVNKKSPFDSNRHSGLDMLDAVETGEVSRSELMVLIRATPLTWLEWRGVERLRIGAALALHHHLDPTALGMTARTDRRFAILCTHIGSGLDPLRIFADQLHWLCEYIRLERLQVEKRCACLWQSIVKLSNFGSFMSAQRVVADYVSEQPGMAAYSSIPAAAAGVDSELQRYPIHSSNKHVAAVLYADSLYRTVADGGSYVPGSFRSAPDPDLRLQQEFPDICATKRRQICQIVRPLELPMGRKPNK